MSHTRVTAWIVPITIFVTFGALPAPVPQVLELGGFSFQPYEPFLLLAAAWAICQPGRSPAVKYLVPYAVLCVVVTMWSLYQGADVSKVGSDVRLPIYVAMAMYVASKVVGSIHEAMCIRAVKVTLWFSAIMVVAASVFTLTLAGRSEAASLDLAQSDAATRFLTPTTFMAVAVLAVCLVYLISNNPRQFRLAGWVIPAAVLLVMAFSRNHLLGLAVAVVFAMLAFRSARSIVALVGTVAVVGAIVLLMQLGVARVLTPIPGATFVAAQADSYVGRVIDGLSAEARASDPSVTFRAEEDAAAEVAISASPVVGHGFGYAYKAPFDEPGTFWHDEAPYYAHNFYLWFLIKVGMLGMLTFVWMAFVPLIRVLVKPTSTMQVAVGAAACGLLAISVVAPIPNDTPGAPLLGALLGVVVVLTPRVIREAAPEAARRDTPEPAVV